MNEKELGAQEMLDKCIEVILREYVYNPKDDESCNLALQIADLIKDLKIDGNL